jgi:D-glycero-D-manno-heptose 1,7-bisphosphate phosphatase
MNKAVFLDRDGVLNKLVLNPDSGEYEPPHSPEDLIIYPFVVESLQALEDAGFYLFLISNQPDFAKGKTMIENIRAVHERLDSSLKSAGIMFREYYYCYHHPQGIVPGYSFECECRKPKPHFIVTAAKDHMIDLAQSWMIGDRDSDIECGKSVGLKTILVEDLNSSKYRGLSRPEFMAANLKVAVQIILHN